MVAFATEYAPKIEAPDAHGARQRVDGAPKACPKGGPNRVPSGRVGPQNRARGIFLAVEVRAGENGARSRHPRREKPDTFTKTASGVRYYDYTYNAIGQRTHVVNTGTAFSANDNQVLEKYTWGLDIAEQASGLPRGGRPGAAAGGVGGVLAVEQVSGSNSGDYVYFYDANGNVTQVLDWDAETIAAHYEYDPFGRMVHSTGSYEDENRFRFSTARHRLAWGITRRAVGRPGTTIWRWYHWQCCLS